MDGRCPLRRTIFAALSLSLLLTHRSSAGDWPQILGPHRDGQSADDSLKVWSAAGPRTVWKHELGEGYAGPVVEGSRVIIFHRVNDVERVEALDMHSGTSLWKADFDAVYRGGVNSDTGPRCTPLVHGGKVFVYGAAGDLHCVALETGRKIWSRSTYQEFGGREGYFGAGTTPIIVADRLLVNVGGSRNAGIVAFSLANGKTLWQATSEAASYSSPIAAVLDGEPHAIFVTRMNVVALRASDGKTKFRFPFGERGPTVNAATPLLFDGELFVTASYGIGAKLVRLAGNRVDPQWANDESLSSQFATPVYHQGYLYGTHGREDLGQPEYRCVAAQTGSVVWSEPLSVAHTILVGDRLLIMTVDGQLIVAKASPAGFEPLAKARIANAITRGLPALASGKFLFRTNDYGGGGSLQCLTW